eukprot:6183337-Pleurochrysis_carterae.AAC.1
MKNCLSFTYRHALRGLSHSLLVSACGLCPCRWQLGELPVVVRVACDEAVEVGDDGSSACDFPDRDSGDGAQQAGKGHGLPSDLDLDAAASFLDPLSGVGCLGALATELRQILEESKQCSTLAGAAGTLRQAGPVHRGAAAAAGAEKAGRGKPAGGEGKAGAMAAATERAFKGRNGGSGSGVGGIAGGGAAQRCVASRAAAQLQKQKKMLEELEDVEMEVEEEQEVEGAAEEERAEEATSDEGSVGQPAVGRGGASRGGRFRALLVPHAESGFESVEVNVGDGVVLGRAQTGARC